MSTCWHLHLQCEVVLMQSSLTYWLRRTPTVITHSIACIVLSARCTVFRLNIFNALLQYRALFHVYGTYLFHSLILQNLNTYSIPMVHSMLKLHNAFITHYIEYNLDVSLEACSVQGFRNQIRVLFPSVDTYKTTLILRYCTIWRLKWYLTSVCWSGSCRWGCWPSWQPLNSSFWQPLRCSPE